MLMLTAGVNDMLNQMIIHRDLKLNNVMLHFPDQLDLNLKSKEERTHFLENVDLDATNFEIKIADFGFSKQLENLYESVDTVCGTPLYMSPQIVNKKKYSWKSDVWSIGVLLFELLNGETPFHATERQ